MSSDVAFVCLYESLYLSVSVLIYVQHNLESVYCLLSSFVYYNILVVTALNYAYQQYSMLAICLVFISHTHAHTHTHTRTHAHTALYIYTPLYIYPHMEMLS